MVSVQSSGEIIPESEFEFTGLDHARLVPDDNVLHFRSLCYPLDLYTSSRRSRLQICEGALRTIVLMATRDSGPFREPNLLAEHAGLQDRHPRNASLSAIVLENIYFAALSR
jgi:hypothetical protein